MGTAPSETPRTSGREALPAVMTKIVFRRSSPEIPRGSFGEQPRTQYRAGVTYSRSEEQANPQTGLHQLIVTRERDVWMVNLLDKTGMHITDPGPTFGFRAPILPFRSAENPMPELEFGTELKFFEEHGGKALKDRRLGEIDCTAQELKQGEWHLTLFTRKDNGVPWRLEIRKLEKDYLTVRYDSYEADLPMKSELFAPPEGIRIVERGASAGGK